MQSERGLWAMWKALQIEFISIFIGMKHDIIMVLTGNL